MELQKRNINAGTTQHLDDTIRQVIMDLLQQQQQQQQQVDKHNQLPKNSTSSHALLNSTTTNGSKAITASPIIPHPSITKNGGRFINHNIGNSCNQNTVDSKCRSSRSNSSTIPVTPLVKIIDMAYCGHTSGLRKVSWYYPNFLRQWKVHREDCYGITDVYDDPILWNDVIMEGYSSNSSSSSSSDSLSDSNNHDPHNSTHWTTILHVAIIGGHGRTIHWLITEAGCRLENTDGWDRTALDIFQQLDQKLSRSSSIERTKDEDEHQKQHSNIRELLQRLQSKNCNVHMLFKIK
jgi:hypothetical protein